VGGCSRLLEESSTSSNACAHVGENALASVELLISLSRECALDNDQPGLEFRANGAPTHNACVGFRDRKVRSL
jgi:hypothetical protein